MSKKILLFFLIILFAVLVSYKSILRNLYPIKYEKEVLKYSVKYNIDPNLVYALIKVESKYNPYAKSAKDAIGLMQITPGTGQYIAGLIKDKNYNEKSLYDPDLNIKYGCYYMSKLLKDFGGSVDCMLAAYNGGEGNARKWIKTSKYGDCTLDSSLIPFDETRNYVVKVNKNYRIYEWLYKK